MVVEDITLDNVWYGVLCCRNGRWAVSLSGIPISITDARYCYKTRAEALVALLRLRERTR